MNASVGCSPFAITARRRHGRRSADQFGDAPDALFHVLVTEGEADRAGEGRTHKLHHHEITGNITIWDMRE